MKFRDYVQSDEGNRDLERHFAPVSSQLQASPPSFKSSQRPGDCRSSPTIAGFEAVPRWPSSLSPKLSD